MTTLHCVCGAVLEGSGEALLDAVERHLREEHRTFLGEFATTELPQRRVAAKTTQHPRGGRSMTSGTIEGRHQ